MKKYIVIAFIKGVEMIHRPLDALIRRMGDARRYKHTIIAALVPAADARRIAHRLHTVIAKLLHALRKHLFLRRKIHAHIPVEDLAPMHMQSRLYRAERSKRILSDRKCLIKNHTFRKKAQEIRYGAKTIATHRRP